MFIDESEVEWAELDLGGVGGGGGDEVVGTDLICQWEGLVGLVDGEVGEEGDGEEEEDVPDGIGWVQLHWNIEIAYYKFSQIERITIIILFG